jgi:hypothetical protein
MNSGAQRPRSRLLASLEAAIKAASNPIEAQCLRAERAALLARQGQLERAQGAIDELNSQLAWQPNNNVLRGWLALAEGLHGYYSVIGRGAQPLIETAYDLSRAAGEPGRRLHAVAAAWLANMAFANDDMPRMAGLVREALDAALPSEHGARARAALVAAYALHFAGQGARSMPWYEASRRHAIALGDEAHLSALMHNQAWMRASQARMALLFDDDAQALAHAAMGAESIGHYDAGIGTASLGSLVPMLRAQLLTAQQRWREALDLFNAHHTSAMGEGLARIAANLLADRAWCEWQLGAHAASAASAARAEAALAEPIDIDDQAMALARLAQVRQALGDAATSASHLAEARRLHAAHREQQGAILRLIDEALAGLDAAAV